MASALDWARDTCRAQFQWRADAGRGLLPPGPSRILRALRSFAESHGLRLQEQRQLLGHFHAPWLTIWQPGANGALVIAVRRWAASRGSDEAPFRAAVRPLFRGNPRAGSSCSEVIWDISVDTALDATRRRALWSTWRSFSELAPVWERGSRWLSSSSRWLREGLVPGHHLATRPRDLGRTIGYWER